MIIIPKNFYDHTFAINAGDYYTHFLYLHSHTKFYNNIKII